MGTDRSTITFTFIDIYVRAILYGQENFCKRIPGKLPARVCVCVYLNDAFRISHMKCIKRDNNSLPCGISNHKNEIESLFTNRNSLLKTSS